MMLMMKVCGLTFEHLDGDSGDDVFSAQTVRRRLNNLPKCP